MSQLLISWQILNHHSLPNRFSLVVNVNTDIILFCYILLLKAVDISAWFWLFNLISCYKGKPLKHLLEDLVSIISMIIILQIPWSSSSTTLYPVLVFVHYKMPIQTGLSHTGVLYSATHLYIHIYWVVFSFSLTTLS